MDRHVKTGFHFEFGDIVWFSYIEPMHTVNKHGIRLMQDKNEDMRFSLPKSGKYLCDYTDGKGKKKMLIEGAEPHTKKITTDSFRNTLKLLVEKLDKKDKRHGNSNLITQLTQMFPESPYYTTNPEWFV